MPIVKNTSCCNGETKTEKEKTTKETSSCCSSKTEIPIIPITKETSCCSSNNNSIKTETCCSAELALQKESMTSKSSCCSDSSCEDPSPLLNTQKISGDGVQTYLVEGMDCGACALTIEKHLHNVSGVEEVRVNFATGKMHIRHDRNVDDIIKEVSNAGFEATLAGARRGINTCFKIKKYNFDSLRIIFSFRIWRKLYRTSPPSLITLLYAVSIGISGYKPAKSAYYAIKSRSLDMNVLMTVAALGAAFIGEWLEGATVVWLFALGVALQNKID